MYSAPGSRADLQSADFQDLVAGSARARWLPGYTSGSVGVPLRVAWSRDEFWIDRLNNLRSFWRNGWRPPGAVVQTLRWRRTSSLPARTLGRFGLAMPNLYVGDPPERQLARLRHIRPSVVYGFTSYIGILAEAALSHGVGGIRPKLIVTTADPLTASIAGAIRQAFGCEPLQSYGSVELGTVAWECRQGRKLHVHSDLYHVEVLRDGQTAAGGQTGEITCTSLFRYTMPLIRYQPGDLGVAGAGGCLCGAPHGYLEEFSGRTDSVVRLPSGRLLTARLLSGPLSRYHQVRSFRIVQEARDRLVVEVVAGDGFEVELEEGIRHDLRAATGGEAEVEVRRVQSIPLTTGRKQAVVVALPPEGQAPAESPGSAG